MKYAVTVEGGWLTIVDAGRKRDAESIARRDFSYGSNLKPSEVEAFAQPATPDDIAWHKAMGGNGGEP